MTRPLLNPHLALQLVLLTLAAGCGNGEGDPKFGIGNGGGGGGDGSGDDTSDPTDDTGVAPGDTGGGAVGYFDEPGDIATTADEEGLVTVELGDSSGDSNQGQEFYYIMVNTGEESLGYELYYRGSSLPEDTGAAPPFAAGRPRPAVSKPKGERSESRLMLEDRVRSHELARPAGPPPPPTLSESDIGSARTEFRVRNSLTDDSQYDRVFAQLWGLGDSVAIWVDVDVPIDWDYECDGIIDVPAVQDAYGFDNCDLATVAEVVDTNIVPNVRTYFGIQDSEDPVYESDINADGRVSVVITPVLNAMALSAEDEDDRGLIVKSYVEPAVDLTEYDAEENPGSDEQEVIYVFAPDPYGFYNGLGTATVDEYASMELSAQIARSFQRLISYNIHVLYWEGEEDESVWLREGLGALAADLCGFGAAYYDDVWDYMDASHLVTLVDEEEVDDINTKSWGAQYLFVRYLADVYGLEIVQSYLAPSGNTGKDNVAAGLKAFNPDMDFDSAVLNWQIALLTTGITNTDGDPLVATDLYPPYGDSTFITAPTSAPSPGDLYGANGYQTGVDVGGYNYYMQGGTTSEPSELEANRVLLQHTDPLTMVAGFPFFGAVAGGYGAQVVRLTGIPYDVGALEVQASNFGYKVAVVRWSDPTTVDWVKEASFSSAAAESTALPELPADGSAVFGIGEIKSPASTTIVTAGEDVDDTVGKVYDTDRWLIDLSAYSLSDSVRVSVHLDRHYDGLDGEVGLEDPWLALVPEAWVPTPTVSDTRRATCSGGGDDFAYPSSILEHLYYQVFLSPTPLDSATTDAEADTGADPTASFDPCGIASDEPTDCSTDWDSDGVLDEDEPQPGTFLQQVQVEQCTLAGGDLSAFVLAGSNVFDNDERDDDEESYYDRAHNLGGRTSASGEEAYIDKNLQGGQRYLLIVGGGEDLGTYELTAKIRN